MIAERFANNASYRQYEELLIQLHRMFCVGKEDSEEADALRDKMDAPGLRLSPEEADRLGGLSGDLFQIQNDEVFAVVDGTQAKEARLRIQKAMDDRNWPELLEALRHRPVDMSNTFVAYQRFRAYAGLGHWLPAAEFIAYCLDHTTGDPGALLSDYLDCMQRAGRSEEALQRVAQVSPQGVSHLHWLLQLASVLQQASDRLDLDQRNALLEHAITGFQSIIREPDLESRLSPGTLLSLYGSLSLCLAARGQYEEARGILDEADRLIADDPYSSSFLQDVRARLDPSGDDVSRLISPAIQEHLKLASAALAPGLEFVENTA